jgi:hypothetical protein
MNPKLSLEFLSNLPLHIDTWDADPDLEDAVAEEITFDIPLGRGYNDRQLKAILEVLEENETPISFRRNGGVTKNPHELYMTSMINGEKRTVTLYYRVEYYPRGPEVSGLLPWDFEDL